MMVGWNEISLGELATFRNGLNFKNDSHGSGCYIIGIPDFQNYFRPEYSNLGQINPAGVVKDQDYLEKGDILFVRSNGNKDLVGRSLFIDRNIKAVFSGFCIRARIESERALPLFIAYFTRTSVFRHLISGAAGGANIQNLNQGILSRVKINLPSLPTQRKIAAILSAYDDLIENNLKRIKLLEEKAQLTYEEWFVRMKFPGHESTPINEETGLPEGWEKVTLGDCCELIMGQSPKSEFYNETSDGLPFHQGVKDYGFRYPINRTWSTSGNRFAEENSILFSVRAPVGRLNVAIKKIILGRGLAGINHKSGWNSFLFYQLQKIFFKDNLMGGGSIFNSVTKKDMEGIELIHGSNQITSSFNSMALNIDESIKALTKQNQLLKEARDILLPRLMTGMIDVDSLDLSAFEQGDQEGMMMAAEPEANYSSKKKNDEEKGCN